MTESLESILEIERSLRAEYLRFWKEDVPQIIASFDAHSPQKLSNAEQLEICQSLDEEFTKSQEDSYRFLRRQKEEVIKRQLVYLQTEHQKQLVKNQQLSEQLDNATKELDNATKELDIALSYIKGLMLVADNYENENPQSTSENMANELWARLGSGWRFPDGKNFTVDFFGLQYRERLKIDD